MEQDLDFIENETLHKVDETRDVHLLALNLFVGNAIEATKDFGFFKHLYREVTNFMKLLVCVDFEDDNFDNYDHEIKFLKLFGINPNKLRGVPSVEIADFLSWYSAIFEKSNFNLSGKKIAGCGKELNLFHKSYVYNHIISDNLTVLRMENTIHKNSKVVMRRGLLKLAKAFLTQFLYVVENPNNLNDEELLMLEVYKSFNSRLNHAFRSPGIYTGEMIRQAKLDERKLLNGSEYRLLNKLSKD